MSLTPSFPLSMPLSTSLASFSRAQEHGALEKPPQGLISLLFASPSSASTKSRQPLRFQGGNLGVWGLLQASVGGCRGREDLGVEQKQALVSRFG